MKYTKSIKTYEIIIGGDLNEDLSKLDNISKRKKCLLDFINECGFQYQLSGRTFINSKGQDWSEIDYFLCQSRSKFGAVKKTILNSVNSSTSDHKPILDSVNSSTSDHKPILDPVNSSTSDHKPI